MIRFSSVWSMKDPLRERTSTSHESPESGVKAKSIRDANRYHSADKEV